MHLVRILTAVSAFGFLAFDSLIAQEVSQSGLRLEAARAMIAQPMRAPKAMVATVNEYATDAGLEILRKGGNAVDAAVAVAFALAVVHPEAGNLGGGGYLMYVTADGTASSVDYGSDAPQSYIAPAQAGALGGGSGRVGYASAAIPGTVAGMGLAHRKFGKLKWAQCLEPARRLAGKGFPASLRMELILKLQVPVMKQFPETAKLFLHGSDQPLKQGELLVQKDLAATIARIQKKGWEEFYTGETARRIDADMTANKGYLTAAALREYTAREAQPLKLTYRDYPMWITPPSSSGGLAIAVMLNYLATQKAELGMEGSSVSRLQQVEAMRRGFAARTLWLAGKLTIDELMTPEYAARPVTVMPVDATNESADTTHFTIADEQGNIVSNTYTLSGFYGSQVIAKGTGVLFNNYLGGSLKPGQRFPSTMSPVVILRRDGKPWIAFGTPGGPTIPSTLMQIAVNLIDFKMSLRDAVEFPRIHFGTRVEAEPAALVYDVAEKLKQMGQRLNPALRSQGDVQAIQIEEATGWKVGWADGRRGGSVKGY